MKSAQFRNTKTGEEAMRYENPQAPPTCAALGPSTSGVVVGTGSSTGNSGTIVMVSLDTGEVIQKYIGHEAAVEHVAFSADGSQLISTAQDNSVRKWDVASGRQVGQVTGLITANNKDTQSVCLYYLSFFYLHV